MPRRKLFKWAKWTCTVAAIAAASLAVFSRFYVSEYEAATKSGSTQCTVMVGEGLIQVVVFDRLPGGFWVPPRGWSMYRSSNWYWGYSREANPTGTTWEWRAGVLYEHQPTSLNVGGSLMYPVALTLIPAALLWYAGRRRFGAGKCRECGYARAGLPAATNCPECGTVPTQ